jgi:hypothetical protein
VPPEEGVHHDETDTMLMMLDRGRGPPPLEENSFRTMVSNLTGWCPGYCSAVTAGLETDMPDARAARPSTTSHDPVPVPAGADTTDSRAGGASGIRIS